MRMFLGLILIIILCGCHSPAVRCDARLRPINAPAAKLRTEPHAAAPGAAALDPGATDTAPDTAPGTTTFTRSKGTP